MSEGGDRQTTLALPTKVEEGFISPLTTIRGTLEILRDYPDLDPQKLQNFVNVALRQCAVLEKSIDELASAVYAAGERDLKDGPGAQSEVQEPSEIDSRLLLRPDERVLELDLSDLTFSDSQSVNVFFDAVTHIVRQTEQQWYLILDVTGLSVWPEAWVAFAHRSKKLSTVHGLATIRVDENAEKDDTDGVNGDLPDKQAAYQRLAELKP